MRHTKIIATIGPASRSPDAIAALIDAGVDVFRLNFSHGTHEEHGAVLDTIRRVSRERERQVAILQDLSGPKIRTGKLEGGTAPAADAWRDPLELRIGAELGRPGMVSTTYAPLAAAVKPGDRLLLDDGKIELVVEQATPASILTRVVDGGPLGEHKGINAPNVPLPAVGVTPKDETDLRFGLAAGVDLVALSFVQTTEDLARARAIAADCGHPGVPMIAKLERPEAVGCLADIVDASDAVMVARGDLGLEMPLEQVPQVQKQVLRHRAQPRRAGDRRDAGARVDAHRVAPDARRSLRRRGRRRRRRRRDHAVGRDRGRRASDSRRRSARLDHPQCGSDSAAMGPAGAGGRAGRPLSAAVRCGGDAGVARAGGWHHGAHARRTHGAPALGAAARQRRSSR